MKIFSSLISSLQTDFYLHRKLLVALMLTVIFSYSIYFFGEPLVNEAGKEDGIFEYLTALLFLGASFTLGWIFYKTRNVFFALLALLLFVGSGEEISWGQRIVGFGTPDYLKEHNVQGETTLHNIEILNSNDFDSTQKTGWRKLITVDFLYKLFCMCFGVLLPVLVMYLGFVDQIAKKISLPVPPLLLGSFFLINWLVFKFIQTTLLPLGRGLQYYDTVGEIAEFLSAVVFFVLALSFNKTENLRSLASNRK
jgi:hypothetical protein